VHGHKLASIYINFNYIFNVAFKYYLINLYQCIHQADTALERGVMKDYVLVFLF